jgi:glutathione S-transferase
MTIKLHVFPISPRGFKALFAAHVADVPYELVLVNLAAGAQRTPEYTAINPNQRMPALEDGDFKLWESNAIVQYIASLKPETGLLPADAKARFKAIQWQFWESQHWDPACAVFMFERVVKKIFRIGEADPAEIAKGEQQMARLGPVLDGQLAKSRYVAGDTMTVADISLAATFASDTEAGFPVGEYRHLQRWLAEMKALPAWAKTKAMQVLPA